MSGRELIRWSSLHDARSQRGVLGSSLVVALLAGGALAGWIAWRSGASPVSASRSWLAGTLVAFALALPLACPRKEVLEADQVSDLLAHPGHSGRFSSPRRPIVGSPCRARL